MSNRKKDIQSPKAGLKRLQLVMMACSYNFNIAFKISIDLKRKIRINI